MKIKTDCYKSIKSDVYYTYIALPWPILKDDW